MTRRRTALLTALALALPGCRSLTRDTLPVTGDDATAADDPASQAHSARAHWSVRPRTADTVAAALAAMDSAVRAPRPAAGEGTHYDRLVDAARYAIWLARFGGAAHDPVEHGQAALVFTNTAVETEPERADAWYLRAVAAGLVAAADEMYGLDAMQRIRDDARRAASLDPGIAQAGPHRVLGALYLGAPAPPVGVGSLRRALRHLQTAVEHAPQHPGNLLLLTRARRRRGAPEADLAAALDRATELLGSVDDRAARAYWAGEIAAERDALE